LLAEYRSHFFNVVIYEKSMLIKQNARQPVHPELPDTGPPQESSWDGRAPEDLI
jgi:hypothetical protein